MTVEFLNINRSNDATLSSAYNFKIFQTFSPTDKKQYLGDRDNRTCRYCKKNESQTSFKNESHAIPISLGNKTLIDNLECDNCNKHFADYIEDSFSKFTLPHRSFGRIRGRGIPTYRDPHIRVSARDQQNLEITVQDDLASAINESGNLITINTTRQPYYPSAVYKMFIKIGICLMDDEDLPELHDLTSWILNRGHTPRVTGTKVIEWTVPGPLNPNWIKCLLCKAKPDFSDSHFKYMIVLMFGNHQYQAAIPTPSEFNKPKTFIFAPVLAPDSHIEKYGTPTFQDLDLTSGDILRNDTCQVTLSFEGLAGKN